MTRSFRPFIRVLTAVSLLAAGLTTVALVSQFRPSPALAVPNADCTVAEPPTVNGVVQVTTPGHLMWIATGTASLSATIEQQNDLDLMACGNWPGIGVHPSDPFTGTYDGNDHTISNVSISASTNYWGLFRYTSSAALRDLTLDGVTISASGNRYIGALAGAIDTTTVDSVTVLGASITGRNSTGGLVGKSYDDTIENSSSSGTVVATGDSIGGLVGENYGSIADSYSTADVTGDDSVGGLLGYHDGSYAITDSYGTGDVSGDEYVGGLVGYNEGDDAITGSYATGDASGDTYVGGLVGYNTEAGIALSFATGNVSGGDDVGGLVGKSYDGTIENSYATGNVSGDDKVGGLVGDTYVGTIEDSYATGNVSGVTAVGGLVGVNDSALITESFWDIATSTTSTSDGGSGVTTALMKAFATFDTAGWSITNGDTDQTKAWAICNGVTYPFHMWQTQLPAGAPGRFACSSEPGATPVVVLPQAITELITQPVATSTTTTVAPSTTTTVPPTTAPPDTAPAPVAIDGALPELPAGDVTVVEDGQPVTVETIADGNTLVLQATTFELQLQGNCTGDCTLDTTSEGRAVLTLEQDGSATITGIGYQPGSKVDVWLFSEPRYLGQLTVNNDGTFQGNVQLGDIDPGQHTLQVNGTSRTGSQRSANLGVVVNPQALPIPGRGQLPSTGTNTTPIWLVALAFLGLGLIATTRRRHA